MTAKRIYLAWLEHRLRQFLRDARRTREIQRGVLLQKLARNAESDFGRLHGFSSIRSVDDFRRQVPISTFETLSPHLSQVLNGRTQALFGPGTQVLMFAMTSGTTGEPKRLPMTAESFREYKAGWRLWGAGAFKDHQDLLRKKTLQLSSDWRQFASPSGIPCGQISGLAATTRPWIAANMFTPPPATIQIHDWAAKHYTTLRIALAEREIGMIMTANPSTLVELAGRIHQNTELLLRDIHDGTLSCELSPEARSGLQPWVARRDPARARELERLANKQGGLSPKLAWPEMSLLSVWTGGSAGFFVSQLEKWYGELPTRDHGLSASEGRMTIPLSDNDPAGVLEFNHHFFEFVPVEGHGRPDANVLEAHELEAGADYYILLTTSGGLYRYDIHDVVRCTGFVGAAPLLQFLNKGKNFCNLTGEKLSEFQVVSAVEAAFKELGLPVGACLVAPLIEAWPGYVLLVERHQYSGLRAELEASVQSNLERLNEEYASKCASGRLLPLKVREVPNGTWLKMRDARIRVRGNVEEYKHAFLAQDPALVERLTSSDGAIRPAKVSPSISENAPAAPHMRPSRDGNLAVSNSGAILPNQ
ncbi:MAG: GH3 auxin-responsive promoter family protein [Pirellulales bacterium]